MTNITFITGNQNKADYLAKYLGFPVSHQKVDLEKIQSLDLKEVVNHKVRQAYDVVKTPVLVEDVALEFSALGRFPGTFIKFLVDEVPFETICRMLDGLSRDAIARCVFGYDDQKTYTTIKPFAALKPIGKFLTIESKGGNQVPIFNMAFEGTIPKDTKIDMHEDEVSETRWVSLTELKDLMKKSPESFIPAFLESVIRFY